MYESQRDQVAGQQFNIEQAAFGIESAKANVDTVAAMKAANTELKRTLKKDLNIDDVEDIADDMAEMMEEFEEINMALGRNFATPEDLDEADLDAELEMLEDELEEEALEEADSTPAYLQASNMPAVPGQVPGEKNGEEKTMSTKTFKNLLPGERDLGVASLWPEVRKLYGHQTEMVCLASTTMEGTDITVVASACKARDEENAAIRLWNVEKNICLDVLKNGHKSTVASLAFSKDGKLLASVGKDRRLCIWKYNNENGKVNFTLSAIVEAAHKRIIWSANFLSNQLSKSSVLATGSRDGTVKIWTISDDAEVKTLFQFSPVSKSSNKKVEPVTAVTFAPQIVTMGENKCAILALGLENGLIELWSIPLDDENKPQHIHSISKENCHIGTIKKLEWRPNRQSTECLTLASCGIDNGVRLHSIVIS